MGFCKPLIEMLLYLKQNKIIKSFESVIDIGAQDINITIND